MKILIYCTYRVGSKSFGDWLSLELGIPYYFEPLNILGKEWPGYNEKIFDIKTDFIAKISPQDAINFNLKYSFFVKFFDKIIVLYRDNTLEQAESVIWSDYTDKWHQNEKFSNFSSIYCC